MVLSSRSMAPSPMTVTTSPTTGPLEDDFVPLPGTGDISRIIRHPEFRATGGWILLHHVFASDRSTGRSVPIRNPLYYLHVRRQDLVDDGCAIAHAAAVVGDWWTLLIVRDIVTGLRRFDELQAELGISRKVLAERLGSLVEHGLVERRPYQTNPLRHEYILTPVGRGLIPLLIALQEWGSRFIMGDGTLTATTSPRSAEARRVRQLAGIALPSMTLQDPRGAHSELTIEGIWTILFFYPGAYASAGAYPSGWRDIPGAVGCTLEATTFRDRLDDFNARGAHVVGISAQRPDEQAAFAASARIPYPLLSDEHLELAAALRLPTFRAGGRDHIKRLSLIVGRDRQIRRVLYPVTDPAGAADDALRALDRLMHTPTRSA